MNIVSFRNITTFIILREFFSLFHHPIMSMLISPIPEDPSWAHVTYFVFFVSPLSSALYFVLPNSSIVHLGILRALFLGFMTYMVKHQ